MSTNLIGWGIVGILGFAFFFGLVMVIFGRNDGRTQKEEEQELLNKRKDLDINSTEKR